MIYGNVKVFSFDWASVLIMRVKNMSKNNASLFRIVLIFVEICTDDLT